MHDPMTVAFEIPGYKTRERMPWLPHLFTIWHVDSEKDGSDDSCGWFMRCRHGDKKTLDRIVERFDFDWDRVFDPNSTDDDSWLDENPGTPRPRRPLVYTGYFRPEDGQPNLSPVAITVGLFHHAAGIHFAKDGGFNWGAAERFMRRHLAEIIRFAENPTDSLVEAIVRRHAVNCGEAYIPERHRKERIRHFASIIYGWILRETRPWWRHPRWHLHHWRLQFHPLQRLKRRWWDKCCRCGKRGFTGAAYGDWSGEKMWHQECGDSVKASTPHPL